MFSLRTVSLFLIVFLAGCQSPDHSSESVSPEPRTAVFVEDPHSFSRPDRAVTTHLDLDMFVDFEEQIITGAASYNISRAVGADELVLDIDSIEILKVVLDDQPTGVMYSIGHGNEFGQKLTIQLNKNTRKVIIHYKTSPRASALQWLQPEQTLGGIYPFLFTQSQAILARSWIPCQDSPGVRLTYTANVQVPEGMMAVMSASNPQKPNPSGLYQFTMEQPIPPYLISMAAGQLAFEAVDERVGVYAEPALLDDAVYEFGDTPRMLESAERLYGAYPWERYDIIVLPPSFPFGGMENPRLTFSTPTIIAGDRSLTSLIAHELAHSWSGNLVTNATWNDFWLNEGFTVYIEKRIMEDLYGADYSEMINLLDFQDLLETVEKYGDNSPLTRLKLDLAGQDPDEGMSDIAYEKGYNFLRVIEETVGRERFDRFLKSYFSEFAFQSITTEMFLEYLRTELLTSGDEGIGIDEWVYGTGLPDNIVVPVSDRFTTIEGLLDEWYKRKITVQDLPVDRWTTHEWLHFIRNLPANIEVERLEELDAHLYLTQARNAEIKSAWMEVAVKRGYRDVLEELEDFLRVVGRRKFLSPLYEALYHSNWGREEALRIYARARPGYHTVTVRTLDEMMQFDPEKYKGAISL
ncbi:MAG: M1 family peptidase [Cryomorphaceae bacterium]|nr:MAG: M1 family peptidase [Cryomorphaceae bacterium]